MPLVWRWSAPYSNRCSHRTRRMWGALRAFDLHLSKQLSPSHLHSSLCAEQGTGILTHKEQQLAKEASVQPGCLSGAEGISKQPSVRTTIAKDGTPHADRYRHIRIGCHPHHHCRSDGLCEADDSHLCPPRTHSHPHSHLVAPHTPLHTDDLTHSESVVDGW